MRTLGSFATFRPASHSTIRRLVVAIVIGLLSALYVVMLGKANPEFVSDFDQVWAGARALWAGHDPYQVVGPGKDFHWRWPLYYPVPALVAVAPLGLVSVLAARAIFAGTSAALFAWAVFRHNWNRWPVFLAIAFMVSVELGQWSLLFAAAFLVPQIGVIGFAKPNFGVAVAASTSHLRSVLWVGSGTVLLLLVSLVVLLLTVAGTLGFGYAWLSTRVTRLGDSLVVGPRFSGEASLDGEATRIRVRRDGDGISLDAPAFVGRGPMYVTFWFGFAVYHTPPGTVPHAKAPVR